MFSILPLLCTLHHSSPTSHPPLPIDPAPASPSVVSQNTIGRMNVPLSSPNRSAGVMLDLRPSTRISQSVCFYSHVLVTVFPNISALSTALYSICERPDDEVVDEFLRCVPLHDGCDGQ